VTDPLDLDRDLDRWAAWADGRLSAADARALEAALSRDPALAREAEAFRQVHLATAGLGAESPPSSRIAFDSLDLDALSPEQRAGSRMPRWPWMLAAAAVLVGLTAWALGGFGGTGGTARPESANVVLAAIPLSQEPLEPPAALLAGYDPAKSPETGGMSWLSAEAEAAAVARYTGRDVFVYAHYGECPMCRRMDATTLRNAEVRALLARFVPLKLALEEEPEEKVKPFFQAGWPYFAVRKADGTQVAVFTGMHDAAEMKQSLEKALSVATAKPLAWEQAAARARRDADLRAGREALLAARTEAATDPARARETLRQAAARLTESDAGRDLARVLDAWRAESPFPVLTEPTR
jgi:hypothetical protein